MDRSITMITDSYNHLVPPVREQPHPTCFGGPTLKHESNNFIVGATKWVKIPDRLHSVVVPMIFSTPSSLYQRNNFDDQGIVPKRVWKMWAHIS